MAKSTGGMKTTRLLIIAVLMVLAGDAETFTGKCVGVSDGDTVSVMKDGASAKVRLNGIDCPESGQDFGARAKQFTSGLVFGQDVNVVWEKKDRYERILGTVYVGSTNVCEALVENGLAWHFIRYSDDKTLRKLEARARKAEAGLWSSRNPVPPWDFRKQKREGQTK